MPQLKQPSKDVIINRGNLNLCFINDLILKLHLPMKYEVVKYSPRVRFTVNFMSWWRFKSS